MTSTAETTSEDAAGGSRQRLLQNPGALFIAFLLVATPIFVLFVYNSGWGNDQLEYLSIARVYAEGEPLFSFIHGKSFGMYALLAGMMRAGYTFDHVGITLAITVMFVTNAVATYFVVSRHFDRFTALFTGALVAICSWFMEQTYFQTEGFVYLSGLAAFHFTSLARTENTRRNLFLAGLSLAIGFHFKSVVAFYMVGIGVFGLIEYGRTAFFRKVLGEWAVSLAVGFIVGAAGPVVYFAATGRFDEFFEWTIYFPLFHYPSHTLYLVKFFTKLIWFVAIVLLGLGLSLQPAVRERTYGRPETRLALLMGLFSCVALLKTQASHYTYPAAGFLMLFSVIVFRACLDLGKPFRVDLRKLAIVAVAVGTLVPISVAAYRPDVVGRLLTLKDWSEEEEIREFIQARVAPDEKVLFVTQRKCRLYWFSKRRPVMKSVSFSVQTTYYLLRHPEMLLDALDDPDLTLIEFNPDRLKFEDDFFLDHPENRELLDTFHQKLTERFEPAYQDHPWNYYFWAPKERANR